MGRGYDLSNFGFSPGNGEFVQNGWHDDITELKEEDVWGGDQESIGSSDHNYFQQEDGESSKSSKSRKSCLSMELQAAAVVEKKKEHVGVASAMMENGIGGRKDKNGGWVHGFMARKVKLPHGAGGSRYGNGWNEHHDGAANGGGVPQSAPVSVPAWPSNFGVGSTGVDSDCNDEIEEDDGDNDKYITEEEEGDDNDVEYDSSARRRGRLAPHEIVDREYARSQRTTFSVIEGAGRTLKGMDLRRVRNAVWSCTGFAD